MPFEKSPTTSTPESTEKKPKIPTPEATAGGGAEKLEENKQ